MPNRYIICMKWGNKYPAEYVNRLYNMVKRNLTIPFNMVCLTDDDHAIDPAIQCLPIPSLDLPAGLPERGWLKLTTFSADLHGLSGTALFLDLDVVILRNIDHFFHHQRGQQGVHIIKDWKRPWRITGNSSVYRFTLGAYPDMLDDFRSRFTAIRQQFRNEQAYLSWYIAQRGQLHYWPKTWCKSYKYHALRPLPYAWWQPPRKPDCDILIFHGEVNPHDAIKGGGGKWYRHILPAPWLKEYW